MRTGNKKKNIIYAVMFSAILFSCGREENRQAQNQTKPVVSNNGISITFFDAETVSFFKTERVSSTRVEAELTAPAKIAATILPSAEGASQNIVLFDNPELAGNYTQLIQHQINIRAIQNINIKQKQIELDRTRDLRQNNVASDRDLLNSQTELAMEQSALANEKAALIEHEAKLISAGFPPDILRKAKPWTAFLICDIPENQISKIKTGSVCTIQFPAFPNERSTGQINAIADVVDHATRMVKVRISVNNSSNKLKSGMFATVSFGISEGTFISVNKSSLVTIQGKNYGFIKKSANEFERRELHIGQQIGDRIIIFNGLNTGDEIAIEGVMQLKGLSFGY